MDSCNEKRWMGLAGEEKGAETLTQEQGCGRGTETLTQMQGCGRGAETPPIQVQGCGRGAETPPIQVQGCRRGAGTLTQVPHPRAEPGCSDSLRKEHGGTLQPLSL